MAFCDSSKFQVDECGVMRHKRDGNTWVDRLMDGVDIDVSMYLENCGYAYIEEDPGEEIVGERNVDTDVKETSKKWNRQRGEGKFKREKKIPQRKIKRFKTKPKPKHSWHKRLTKIAIELDMEAIGSHTEQRAVQEIGDFYDEYFEEKRMEKEKIETKYWESWVQVVNDNPGHYAMISVKILVDPDGVSVHDIDAGGVKRDGCFDPYNDGDKDTRITAMNEWDKLPCHVGKCDIDTYIKSGFTFKRYNFFTYWDEKKQYYVWKSMNSHKWMCGGWRAHFDYYPKIEKMEEIFCLDKQFLPWREVGKLSRWINGIEWSTVWLRMDEIRTGFRCGPGDDHCYSGGDGWDNRSREGGVLWQIPRMIFY